MREYSAARKLFLSEHPICEVWIAEHGWTWVKPATYARGSILENPAEILRAIGAPTAIEVHHKNKRRGAMLLDQRFWLAVSRENHERIENNKTWGRANGFLHNF